MNAFLAVCLCLIAADEAPARQSVLVVVGASGTPEYGAEFERWAGNWRLAAERGGAALTCIGRAKEGAAPDRERLREFLVDAAADDSALPLWIVLIGHGTYDGQAAKFNLEGPDVAAAELADWLAPVKRPLVVINCASASGPFINALSAGNRAVVTATKSGHEVNYARFGQYLSEAIADPAADLDKDDQTSLLEAFLTASGRVEEFYRTASRLATEHALIDDNGDQLGTPAAWFRGIRATQRAKDGAALDGIRAHQFHLVASDREESLPADRRARRDELELAIAALREEKPKLPEDEYYTRLELLMLELARLYQ